MNKYIKWPAWGTEGENAGAEKVMHWKINPLWLQLRHAGPKVRVFNDTKAFLVTGQVTVVRRAEPLLRER